MSLDEKPVAPHWSQICVTHCI